jgi:hypothetical protein
MRREVGCLIVFAGLSLVGPARAQAAGASAAVDDENVAARPAPVAARKGEARDSDSAGAGDGDEGQPKAASDVAYGVGLRGRWVSVPSWMLGVFTKHNVPLSTFGHVGIEGFRRHGNFDVVISFSYQNMSPGDGNWLGIGKDATVDTNYVQFRGLAIYTADVSFVWHAMLNQWMGVHYGAGLGVGVVSGHVLRTVSAGCTESNVGDLSQCHPVGVTCANGSCTPDAALQADGRFADSNVPSVVPIVNVVLGVDFRLPNVKGWEAKIEGGFYDAFFAGLGVGYTF